MISGILTAVLLVAFVGIFFWAYAPSRKQRFAEAAALALIDDAHGCASAAGAGRARAADVHGDDAQREEHTA